MSDEHEYAVLYEAEDDWWDENELHVVGKDVTLESYLELARHLVEEGHRNVRVVEYVTVAKEVYRP